MPWTPVWLVVLAAALAKHSFLWTLTCAPLQHTLGLYLTCCFWVSLWSFILCLLEFLFYKYSARDIFSDTTNVGCFNIWTWVFNHVHRKFISQHIVLSYRYLNVAFYSQIKFVSSKVNSCLPLFLSHSLFPYIPWPSPSSWKLGSNLWLFSLCCHTWHLAYWLVHPLSYSLLPLSASSYEFLSLLCSFLQLCFLSGFITIQSWSHCIPYHLKSFSDWPVPVGQPPNTWS